MLVHEYFTRCAKCGSGHLTKEERITASYQHDTAGHIVSFNELPEHREIRYACADCSAHIHTIRE